MASHRSKSLYAIKECSTCGSLYTRDCCSIGSLEDKILTPVPDSSPCCAKCGTPVDGPYCRGCALLRKKFKEDLLTYCVENGIFQDSQDTFESSDDNTNVINALQEPIVVNQDPGEKSSCRLEFENLSKINEWGHEVRKKEQAYEEEQYAAARRRMLSIHFVDEDDYIPLGDIIARYSTFKAITPDLPIEEPDNSLNIGDEHLDTIPATESDEVIKSSVENLVPIPSEFEGISDDTSDVPTCDNNCVNVESDFVESLINQDYFDSFEEVNDFEQEEKRVDSKKLEDILQIQDVILRERLLKISCLITNIESLKDNPTPIPIEPDQEGLINIDISDNSTNDFLLELPEFESFHFDPSFSRPPPEPPDVEICLHFEPDAPVIDNFNELNDDQRGSEIDFSQNVEDDDSFTFVIRTFLPFLTYPEVSPLSCSTRSEDTIFDPGIST
ncbi:hypothetical protein Tco_0951833 [Tanacetum coccineum]|uniref:Uncharacterized protein n=1 Tax=Tanacetum coccineum TaxID=301880 RepID=A0ABQ5DVZ6_9ASTR